MKPRAKQIVAWLLLAAFMTVSTDIHAQSAADPHWLLKYQAAGSDATNNANELMWDKRFKPFLNHYLPQRPYLKTWSRAKMSLGTMASELFGNPDRIQLELSSSNHEFEANGCMAHVCSAEKGLLWVDLETASPTVIFAAIDQDDGKDSRGEKLYVFTGKKFSAQELPTDFQALISQWTEKSAAGDYGIQIGRAVIVAPSGREEKVGLDAVGVA